MTTDVIFARIQTAFFIKNPDKIDYQGFLLNK